MTDPSAHDLAPPAPRHLARLGGRAARMLLVLAAALGALVLTPSAAGAQGDEGCSDYEWHTAWSQCVEELPEAQELQCEAAPQPASPDSGMAGWFAEPSQLDQSEGIGTYSRYGYAGYQLPMYGSQQMSVGGQCVDSVSIPNGADTANALANMEFNLSVATVGAANSMRQAAWEPDTMWGWSNRFMEQGTEVLYRQIFTVFGAVTVGLIGLYLLWRSRQADMNNAVTTVAWAVLILVLVTAVVRWPVKAAEYTDQALTIGMDLSTVLISDDTADGCVRIDGLTQQEYEDLKEDNEANPDFCIDTRSAAVTASDTVSGQVLYQNWLRTMLGQSEEVTFQERNGEVVEDGEGNPVVTESNTAYKYGPALFAAQAMSWQENEEAEDSATVRNRLIEEKQELWQSLVAQIQTEDPEAYANISGQRAWERTGTGLLALLTAIFFSLFDLTASILIILGFMIVRFAIVALPIIGTIALLRPAGGPFKRLVNTVLGAIINVAIFSLAAVIYIWASSRILQTAMPVWLQVVMIGLLGVAAWLLLRPGRRIAGLVGGSGPADAFLGRRGGDSERSAEREREQERARMRRDDARPEESSDTVRPLRAGKGDSLPEQQTTPDKPVGSTSGAGSSTSTGSGGGEVYRPSRRE
ncbi:hypothetical protein [Glycomyces terrestris]|uniref:MFS transporter n=1 Tax=Glycomyces terrestris TaxID=2493553 RepID=A0A426UY31_9ACTN|nr:hypothetical protein [Glycomyces terrestris]RRR99468.1 hypothetical protein EIW28_12235 [Glycomyces terrestris]